MAVTPAAKVVLSPLWLPRVRLPVLLKVVASVTVAPPKRATSKAAAPVSNPLSVALPLTLAAPVCPVSPSVKVSVLLTEARVMAPLPDLSVTLVASVTAPSAIALFVVANVPATKTPLGTVAVRPPVKVVLSVLRVPSVKAPVLWNVVAVVTVLAVPSSAMA